MMRMYRFILPLIALMLNSCLETEDPDVCSNEIDTNEITAIGMISKVRIKEIKAVANKTILCSNNYELLYVKGKNENFYHLSDIDSITYFHNKDWFVNIGCYVIHNNDMKNKRVVLQILKYDGTDVLDINELLIGKKDVSVISEQDTAWLFSYKNSLSVNGDPYYNFSASTRLGCHDGYCFVSMPMLEDKLCFDR